MGIFLLVIYKSFVSFPSSQIIVNMVRISIGSVIILVIVEWKIHNICNIMVTGIMKLIESVDVMSWVNEKIVMINTFLSAILQFYASCIIFCKFKQKHILLELHGEFISALIMVLPEVLFALWIFNTKISTSLYFSLG